jgi:exodeoxyribonuclease-3
LFGTTNTQFIHNLRGNTQITRNVRQVTKGTAPVGQAAWNLGCLHEYLSMFLFEVYDTIEHPALGQSPRSAYLVGVENTGVRANRAIAYDQAFLMATLPTTPRGTAKCRLGAESLSITFTTGRKHSGIPPFENHDVAVRYDPVLTRSSLPGNPKDRQARYIEAAVNGVLITSIYLPNGNPQPGPKFDYKLARFERLVEHGTELMKAGVPVVLAGDYNVVPTVQDIYPTRSLDNNALIQPQSRQAYARLLAQGWTDALRKLQLEGPLWTFWDYERNRWPLDKGMRLDHFLLSPTVCDRLVHGGVDRWVRGEENASDHAPAWIVLDR